MGPLPVLARRPWRAVPGVFWLLGAFGLAGVTVAAWAAGTGRSPGPARWLLLAGAGYLLLCLAMGLIAGRGLGLPGHRLWLLRQAYHLGNNLYALSLLALLWGFPRPLGRRWLLGLLLAWVLFCWANEWWGWVDLPGHDVLLQVGVLGAAAFGALGAQLLAARADPGDRALVLWLLLAQLPLLAVAMPFYFFLQDPHLALGPAALEAGLGAALLVLAGCALAVARFRLQEVERWWTETWIWLTGGALVLGLYLAVSWLLPPLVPLAPFVALAVAGWLHQPLRRLLWRLFYPGVPAPPLGEGLPHRVLEVAAAEGPAAERLWRNLLDELFQPLHMESLPPAPLSGGPAMPQVVEEGRALLVPALRGGGYRLGLPGRGTRLYGRADRELAGAVHDLVVRLAQGLEEQRRGAVRERQRILADLRQGVERRLRVLAQRCEGTPAARIVAEALQALEEVIHSTREPGAREPLVEAAGRWRAQVEERLAPRGLRLGWRVDPALEGVVLGGLDLLHLGRILQEAVSNALRHARPSRVEVALERRGGFLTLRVSNDGVVPRADEPHGLGGQGLSNMGRRARELGGVLRLEEVGGCFTVTVDVPLPAGEAARAAGPREAGEAGGEAAGAHSEVPAWAGGGREGMQP
ncbi:MAG: hypothetical protein D6809_05920 [Gammaproteobacteria bacterium]|nr:MAG: hypothetical protein D6809_05920 [Gammaproteobacteria bacterium]